MHHQDAYVEGTRAALQRQLTLSKELAAAISEAVSLDDALRQCLAKTCDATAWEVGKAWMASGDDPETLRCRASWTSEARLDAFLLSGGTLDNDRHSSLPGRAWTSAAAVWLDDIQSSESVAQRKEAAQAGLSSAAAVPVLAGGHPIAVLEFFTRAHRAYDEETSRMLSEVADCIGPILRLQEARGRLGESESRFRALAETAADAIISADRAGTVVYLNPRAREMFGYLGSEPLGRPLTDLAPERHHARHSERFERLVNAQDARTVGQTIELTGRRADATEFPLELSLSAHGDAGAGAFVNCIIRDTSERREADRRVRRREGQLAEAQRLAKLGSWDWDLRTGEETWSDEMFRIYGVPSEGSAAKKDVVRHRDPDDARMLRTRWEQAIKEGRPFSLFHRISRPDGCELTLHSRGNPSLDADGNVVGVVGTTQDVTEQLRLKEERQQAEVRFQKAFENAPIGMTMDLPDGRFARVNEAFCEMTGYSRETLEGKHSRELTHPDDVPATRQALTRLLRGGEKSIELDRRYRHAEGWWIDARVSISLILDAKDQPALFIAHIEDVTDIKQGERALRESGERLQAILDNAPMAVHMKDLDGHYMLVNSMAAKLAGLEPEELIGKAASELFLGEPAIDVFIEDDHQDIGSHAPASTEREIQAPDGPMTLLTEKFPVRDSEGDIYAVAAVSVDISYRVKIEKENRRLESELQEARRLEAVGGLAGGIAHDFNNLLAVILNYAVLAREGVEEAAPVAQELDEIRKAAERAADLTQKLLVFSRQEGVEPQVLDLNAVVSGGEWLLRRTLGDRIELSLELGEELWHVEGHAAQLEGSLLNLAVNAVDAMPSGGTLSVRTDNVALDGAGPPAVPAGRYVRLTVSDTGSGMAEDVALRAFDPFFSTKPTGEGTGLGLATVQGIARQAGGTVELRSRPGGGTTVTTYLPASERNLTPEPAPLEPDGAEGAGQTVLVVEDEPSVQRMISRILSRSGYSVHQVSPTEALEACAFPENPVDLLLTDVVMPAISGGKLAAHARELRPELNVLFISGYVNEAKLESEIHELVPFLQKPFSPAELLHAIKNALAQAPRATQSG